ncbi:MAG: GAF domain-containing protein [Alicyclobacillus macrosporangiidus]|uniref:GAF domain-containing protein n=1 Tax=Alicyclobacillus macrosporangiidus TaxID=392015 RepID=UPI0026F13DEC|nr:GAF domain-containing protein [Alicyclobacillus macrosporangiidus]MCL6597919.1 GAF domain-containing protein [Alicyclobacillus macrosporangiidus]
MKDNLADKIVQKILDHLSWQWLFVIVFGTLVLYIGYSAIILYLRHRKGAEIEFEFLKFKAVARPNSEIRKLERAFEDLRREYDKLNQDSKHKSDVLKHMDAVGQHAQRMFEMVLSGQIGDTFDTHFQQALTFILHVIHYGVRNGKTGMSRIGIFVPDGEDLKLLCGLGYSPRALQNLRFPISNSFVGSAFKTKEVRKTGDISQTPGPFLVIEGQHEFNSLICIPIQFLDEVVGVLNVDCQEKQAFTDFDADILGFFANQLALLLVAHRLKSSITPTQNEPQTEIATEIAKGAGQSGT